MTERNRRPESECENLVKDRGGYTFVGRPDRARYRGNRCDGFEVPVADVRVSPVSTFQSPDPDVNSPPLIAVENDSLVLTCDDRFPGAGRTGADVEIPAGQFILLWDWREIPDITADRLNWYATETLEFREQVLTMAAAPRAQGSLQIRAQYRLKLAQAIWVWESLNTIFSRLDEYAEVAATSALDCYWESAEQTATCDDSVRPAEAPNSVTAGARAVRSYTSQADADAQALALAQSQLDCMYANAEQTVDCQTDLGFTDPVPVVIVSGAGTLAVNGAYIQLPGSPTADFVNLQQTARIKRQSSGWSLDSMDGFTTYYEVDDAEWPWAPDPGSLWYALDGSEPVPSVDLALDATGQQGSVTVEAGTILDRDPNQADARALELAVSQLNCFYVNNPLSMNCYDLHGLPLLPALIDYGPADPSAVSAGSTVYVPVGFYQSAESQAQANELAQLLAESLLRCEWGNDALTETCQDFIEYQADGVTPTGRIWQPNQEASEAAGGSQAYTATVPENTFTSPAPDGSKAQAQDQAQVFALAQLLCVYCNNEVAARCVDVGGEVSYDKTDGVEAGLFCSTDAISAQEQAEALASIPTRVKTEEGSGCRYGNRRVVAKCAVDPDGPEAGEVDVKVDGDPTAWETLSAASLGQEVVVPANTFFVLEGEGTDGRTAQQEADHLAVQVAFASLDCYWENDRVAPGACADNGTPVTTVLSPWFAQVTAVYLASGSSRLGTHIIKILVGPPGEEWYPIVGLIPRDYTVSVVANQQIEPGTELATLVSPGETLICADIECAAGTTPALAPGVEAGLFNSYESKAEANDQALAMAQTLTQCIPTEPPDLAAEFRPPEQTVVFGPWEAANNDEQFKIYGKRLSLPNPITPGSISGNTLRIYRIRLKARPKDPLHVNSPFSHYFDETSVETPDTVPTLTIDSNDPDDLEIKVDEEANGDRTVTVPVYTAGNEDGVPKITVINPSPTFSEFDQRGLDGFWIYRRNGAAMVSLSWADVLALWDPENAGADNFNLEFGVTSGVLDAVSLAGSTSTSYGNTALYDGDAFADPAVPQSYYLIPIRRSGQWICRGGVFRENRFCTDKGLITELVRIG